MFRTVILCSVCLKCWITIAFSLRSSTFTVGVIAEVPGNSRQNSQNFWLLGNNYTSLVNIVPVVSNVRWWDTLEVSRAICHLLDEDVDVLLSFAPSEVDPILFSYARSFKLPLITSSFPPQSVNSKFDMDINLIPNSNEAVADILKYYKWKTFVFFYDNDNGPERLQDILRLTNYMMDVESVWKVSNEEECRRLLNYAENRASQMKSGTINALFATQERLLDDVIRNIDYSEDSATKHHFILAEPSLGDLQRRFFQWPLITKFALVDKQTSVFQSFLKTWTALQPLYDYQSETQLHHLTEKALLTLDAIRLISMSLTQAVQGSALDTRENRTIGQMSCITNNGDDSVVASVNGMAIINFMRTASFERGVTGNIQFNTQGERKNFSFGVIERSHTIKKFAEWSDANGLKVYNNKKKSEDFQDDSDDSARKSKGKTQNGKHFVITTVLTTPFLMMRNNTELSGNDRFYGFVKDLLDQISSNLKFSYQIQLVKDNRYGKIINGEWKGMIGEVVREEADMAVAPLTVTRRREEVVDFTIPFMSFGLNILMKKSASTLPDKNFRILLTPFGFFKALAYDVWLILLALFIIMSAMHFAVSKFTGFPDRIRSMDTKGSDRLTLCSSVWFAVGSLFLQNTAIYPRSFSHRVMSIVWWTFSILIVIIYICSLSSLLITETTIDHGIIDPNIGSLRFLQRAMEKGSPTIGALASGSTAEFFLKSEIGVFRDYGIFFKNNVNVSVNSYSEGARRVRSSNGSYALIMESLVSGYESNLLPCDTVVTSGHLDNRVYSIAVKKGSFLKEYLDESLLELMESGSLRQIYEKWWHSEAECNDYSLHALAEIYSSSLNINEVSGVFYLLIIGSVAACITAAVEYAVRSKKISVDK